MSIGKYILIDPSLCPSRQELKATIERLYKDADILTRLKRGDDPDPRYLRNTAQFLERLYLDNRLKHSFGDEDEEAQAIIDIEKSKQPKMTSLKLSNNP